MEEEGSGVPDLSARQPESPPLSLLRAKIPPKVACLSLSEMGADERRRTGKGEAGSNSIFLQGSSYRLLSPVLTSTSQHSPSQPFLLASSGPWGAQAASASAFPLPPEACHSRGSLPVFCGIWDGFRMTVDNV